VNNEHKLLCGGRIIKTEASATDNIGSASIHTLANLKWRQKISILKFGPLPGLVKETNITSVRMTKFAKRTNKLNAARFKFINKHKIKKK